MALILKERTQDDLKAAIAHLYGVRSRDVVVDLFRMSNENRLHIGITVTMPSGLHTLTQRPPEAA